VALDLLKNVNISAGGVLPMCQDTGTAIVMGKKSEGVLTGADDGEAISSGVYDAYTKLNLRYSQLAPLTMWEEKNTGTNLPAQIELYSTPSSRRRGRSTSSSSWPRAAARPTSRSSTRRRRPS
jgi:fumarate hydratase class I